MFMWLLSFRFHTTDTDTLWLMIYLMQFNNKKLDTYSYNHMVQSLIVTFLNHINSLR